MSIVNGEIQPWHLAWQAQQHARTLAFAASFDYTYTRDILLPNRDAT